MVPKRIIQMKLFTKKRQTYRLKKKKKLCLPKEKGGGEE